MTAVRLLQTGRNLYKGLFIPTWSVHCAIPVGASVSGKRLKINWTKYRYTDTMSEKNYWGQKETLHQ